jgi:hypothetical protein
MIFKNLFVSFFLLAVILIPRYAASQEQKKILEQTHDYQGLTQAEIAFEKAHQNFINKDYSPAGKKMMIGREYVYKAAQEASQEGKEALLASVDELEKIAKDVEKGGVKEEKELKDAFARSYYASAQDFYLKAKEAWEKKGYEAAGYLLRGAGVHLELGLSWSGGKMDSNAEKVIKNTRTLGGELEKGAGWTNEQVEKTFTALEGEIKKLEEKVKLTQS